MSGDLASWLLEQIAEDEQRAADAKGERSGRWTHTEGAHGRQKVVDDLGYSVLEDDTKRLSYDVDSEPWHTCPHIATWDPKRVLAECDAKRRLVDLHRSNDEGSCITCMEPIAPCDTLQVLTLPYVDRDGYREEWRP